MNNTPKRFSQFVRAVFVCAAVLAVSTTVGLITDAHALTTVKTRK